MKDDALAGGLSDSEYRLLMGRLYDLLSRQTTKYLAGDSTSIPAETAEELLRSLSYTLRLALAETGLPARGLLTHDLEGLLRQGQRILQSKLALTQQLWEQACLTAPPIQSAYLQDTLKGITGFFRHYDLWYFAHQIPCAIDYPLCVPVPETLEGLSYVEQWLRSLLIENWFLAGFRPQSVERLLSGIAADYAQCPLNLCEQPLLNAVGLALLGRPAAPLDLSEADCRDIEALLLGCRDVGDALNRGAAAVAAQLRAPPQAADYMKTLLGNTLPRIRSALQFGSLGGVFIA